MSITIDPNVGEDLCTRIQAAIKPWTTSKKKPPYSAEQLIAMALLSVDSALSVEDICVWLLETFEYYRKLIVHSFWNGGEHGIEHLNNPLYKETRDFRSEIQDAITSNKHASEHRASWE